MLRTNTRPAVLRKPWPLAPIAAIAIIATQVLTGGISAQQDQQIAAQQPVIELVGLTADSPEQAKAVVTVLGADGLPVAGLTGSNVQVQVNDVFVPVAAVDRGVDSTLPIAIVLALDVSGSMAGGALEEAKAAARLFLADLQPGDSVAVVTFNDTVQLVVPFTQDHDAAVAAIDGLTASGATALYQATDESVRIAAATGHPYRAVVLLSDGLDHGSALLREDVMATVDSLGVPVFTIGLGEEIDQAYLAAVSDTTGGSFAATPSADGLAALFAAAGERLRGQYILTIDTSSLNLTLSEPMHVRVHITTPTIREIAERDVCAQQLCIAVAVGEAAVAGEAVTTYVASVISSDAIASVTFLLDGVSVGEATASPYVFSLDASLVADAEHDLTAVVETVGGAEESSGLVVGTPPVEAGGGIGTTLIVVAGAAVLVAVIGAFVYVRRRPKLGKQRKLDPANLVPPSRGGPSAARKPDGPDPEKFVPEPAVDVAPTGRLQVIDGALAGQWFSVGSAPVSIGSASRCLIRMEAVDNGDQLVAPEHARVWVRDNQLMVHEIQRLTAYGPKGGRWQKLESGDSFSVGPYEIRFAVGADVEKDLEVPNVLRTQEPADENGATDGSPGFGQAASGGLLSDRSNSQQVNDAAATPPSQGDSGELDHGPTKTVQEPGSSLLSNDGK